MLLDIINNDINQLVNVLAVLAITTTAYYLVIFPLFYHPLAKIPGPTICSLSKYWILYKSWSEQRNRYVNLLHEKYGPIVRIGPDEVDISDVKYLQDIYVRNFDKSTFYTQFVSYDSGNTFSTVDKKTHKDSRKVSHKFYSKTNICSDNIQSKVEKVMIKTLGVFDESKNKDINCFILFSEMAMDAVNAFAFGDNYISVLDDPWGKGKEVIDSFGLQSSAWFWTTQMPQWYEWVIDSKVNAASAKVSEWIDKQFRTCYSALKTTAEGLDQETLLSTLVNSDTSSIFTQKRIKSELFDHIAAGHITTGTTMAYLCYELAKNVDIQKLLQEELKEFNQGKYIKSNNYNPIRYTDIDEKLPIMQAVITETFRVHAAIPGQEPRVTPPGGMIWRGTTDENVKAYPQCKVETEPCKIPGGTIVTMQPWSLHRVPGVFENENEWQPMRWIDSTPERIREMKRHLMHFGAGSRMCIGQHLATAEINIILASLLSRYSVELVDGWDYERDSEMLDIYTTVPRSECLLLRFVPLL
ncbi:hypothetical protein DAMA08_019320 [Martiniozyma asiatica (nom. inval.)]|nr:hypothetical protein DAMA08_019320 [Martiniozyma asiatica]